jgi:hypothetical protein
MLDRNAISPNPGVSGAGGAAQRNVGQTQLGRGAAPKGFTQALQQAQGANAQTVDSGDTLIGMIRDYARSRGQSFSPAQEFQLAQQVAGANRISNANRIFVGQKIDLSVLDRELAGAGAANMAKSPADGTPVANGITSTQVPATPAVQAIERLQTPAQMRMSRATEGNLPRPVNGTVPASFSASTNLAHPVLVKTLDRAVAKGFIPPTEKAAVYDKILDMAKNHGFAPDDFARMTLMESDGMNPRASNQRCHGIIQFCDGPARGAASAGYASNPKAILDLSVHTQLGLVDKYFDDVGLKNQGPSGLEDLYLSVLNPASRAQSQADAPLNIPGPQARSLHVGSDSTAPITRQSIRQGLIQNAAQRLGQMLPQSLRVQAQRAQQYVENTLP